VHVLEHQEQLLQELLLAYGPPGQEDAVRDVVARELHDLADGIEVDAAGNLVALVRGAGEAPPVVVTAHLDELAMMVKRVEPDGLVTVTPLGTMYPGNFGLGPVVLLGDAGELPGVLSLGSEHVTAESARIWRTKPDGGDKALDWPDVYVFTGLTPTELASAGIHPGTRVCVDGSQRSLLQLRDHIGCYFLDDRAAVVVAVEAARALVDDRPAGDVRFVFSTSEELGGIGASWAAGALPGDLVLALDVGPTEPEYGTRVDGGPIIPYADAAVLYDKAVADRLLALGQELGLDPQPAVLGAFETDASQSKSKGASPRAAALCLPTLSTHGYEVVHRQTVPRCVELLTAWLRRPTS
jgi:putative aminopeptidase FrvX